jgi:hypothetical protein
MSRTGITKTSSSIGSDSGSTLFSFVQGEQQEIKVQLTFLTSMTGYVLEAVVMEALNVSGLAVIPSSVKPAGVNTVIPIRVPTESGIWLSSAAYSRDAVVYYNSISYRRTVGTNVVSATPPSSDPNWELYTPNCIFLQFPSSLASTWTVKALPESPVYGFFELRVTEPVSTPFPQTWKPMRGVVEILFSPTDLVP